MWSDRCRQMETIGDLEKVLITPRESERFLGTGRRSAKITQAEMRGGEVLQIDRVAGARRDRALRRVYRDVVVEHSRVTHTRDCPVPGDHVFQIADALGNVEALLAELHSLSHVGFGKSHRGQQRQRLAFPMSIVPRSGNRQHPFGT